MDQPGPTLSSTALVLLRIAVPLACAALLVVWTRSPNPGRARFKVGLAALALAALASWTWPSFQRGTYLNPTEFFDYYVASKYADEVGYTNMIDAAVVAQHESGATIPEVIRDLRSYERVRSRSALVRAPEIRARFSDERWAEFSEDIRAIRGRLSDRSWEQTLNDRGFNATPVWTLVAARFSRITPTSSYLGLRLLPFLDVALMTGAFAAIAWAFGATSSLLAIIFVFSSWYSSSDPLRAAFLRTDWIACLVVATCLLKKGHYGPAGALTAYAALCRVFPLFFAAALAGRGLWAVIDERRLPRRYVVFFGSFMGTAAILVALSVLDAGGVGRWREWIAKISEHSGHYASSAWTLGLLKIMSRSDLDSIYGEGVELLQGRIQSQAHFWWSVQALATLAIAVLLRRLRDPEALCFGMLLVFVLLAATWYYYISLLLPLLFFADRIERSSWRAGIGLLIAASAPLWWLDRIWGWDYPLAFVASCLAGVALLYMAGLAALEFARGGTDLSRSAPST
jgi:hypothetical protein